MPNSDLLLAGAPARIELSHQSPVRGVGNLASAALPLGQGAQAILSRHHDIESRAIEHAAAHASTPSRPRRGDAPKKAAPCRKSTPQEILRAFNSWSFKREQPGSPELMLQVIARAVALSEPVPFVLYWGKGPRSAVAAADLECLEFIKILAHRVMMVHEPGAAITLIFTDTHARLNGHGQAAIAGYFAAIDGAARQRAFSTCWLSQVVAENGAAAAQEKTPEAAESSTLAALVASARKWFRGVGTPEEGALRYFRMNMDEKRAVERAFPNSIFITFNGSDLRSLFPDNLPIFYMYSLRRGTSVKPWFIGDELPAGSFACLSGSARSV
jgi:hypothetical protein